MSQEVIPIDRFSVNPFPLFAEQWMLLAGGDFASGDFNVMTVAWGGFGQMWSKPVAHVAVRPQRHTASFLQRYDTFTLTAFAEDKQDDLLHLGTHSGRDGDKLAQVSLTPTAASHVAAPTFEEAELTVECHKVFWQRMAAESLLSEEIRKEYPENDYHYLIFGEVIGITGDPKYRVD